MKLGICGAQSTGKSTLLNALRSESCFKEYAIRNEVTRTIREYGIDINENGSDVSQTLIMKEHIYNLVMFDKMITDRTVLDGLVYTEWLYKQNKVTQGCYYEAIDVFEKTINMYDRIFYIKPEFPIENDGVRSDSEEWQQQIVKLFDEAIDFYKLEVINVSGSVRERVNTVLETIGALENT